MGAETPNNPDTPKQNPEVQAGLQVENVDPRIAQMKKGELPGGVLMVQKIEGRELAALENMEKIIGTLAKTEAVKSNGTTQLIEGIRQLAGYTAISEAGTGKVKVDQMGYELTLKGGAKALLTIDDGGILRLNGQPAEVSDKGALEKEQAVAKEQKAAAERAARVVAERTSRENDATKEAELEAAIAAQPNNPKVPARAYDPGGHFAAADEIMKDL